MQTTLIPTESEFASRDVAAYMARTGCTERFARAVMAPRAADPDPLSDPAVRAAVDRVTR